METALIRVYVTKRKDVNYSFTYSMNTAEKMRLVINETNALQPRYTHEAERCYVRPCHSEYSGTNGCTLPAQLSLSMLAQRSNRHTATALCWSRNSPLVMQRGSRNCLFLLLLYKWRPFDHIHCHFTTSRLISILIFLFLTSVAAYVVIDLIMELWVQIPLKVWVSAQILYVVLSCTGRRLVKGIAIGVFTVVRTWYLTQ